MQGAEAYLRSQAIRVHSKMGGALVAPPIYRFAADTGHVANSPESYWQSSPALSARHNKLAKPDCGDAYHSATFMLGFASGFNPRLAESAPLALTGAYQPTAPMAIQIPVNVLYGVLIGMMATYVVPRLGESSSIRRQLARSLLVGLAAALVTVLQVFLVYESEAVRSLFSKCLQPLLFVLGVGLALSNKERAR